MLSLNMTVLGCILNLWLRQEGATGVSASQDGSVKVVEELGQEGRPSAKPDKSAWVYGAFWGSW